MDVAVIIGDILRHRGLTLGTVESATGGLIAQMITGVPGSSDYFEGSIVSYSNEVKDRIVGVTSGTLEKYGAVSPQVAEEMALGGKKLLEVDICLSDTGIAGPGGAVLGKPVGLFYLGMACLDGVSSRRHEFHGSREENRRKATVTALDWLHEYLLSLK